MQTQAEVKNLVEIITREVLVALREEELPKDHIHGEHCTCYSDTNEMQYVTDGKRKLIWFPRTNIEQFFDLETDPYETTDLWMEHPELVERLMKQFRTISESGRSR